MAEEEEKSDEEIILEADDKYITVSLTQYKQIEFKIMCTHHQTSMHVFMKLMVEKFLEDDERILSILHDWRDAQNKKKVNRKIHKMYEKKKDTEGSFLISKEKLNEMYKQFEEWDKSEHDS